MSGNSAIKGWGRAPVMFAAVVLAIVVVVAVCEALGWPFLVGPMQTWLSKTLDRRVQLSPDAQTKSSVRIGLLGGIRLDTAYLEIGAPKWSTAPHMVLAREAHLRLAYWDLWRAYKGDTLRIRDLQASVLDGQLERTADGRASWQFGAKPPAPSASDAAPRIPTFDKLQVAQGTLVYRDAPLTMNLDAQFSLREQHGVDGAATDASSAASSVSTASSPVPPGLQFHGKGTYLKLPIRVDVETSGAMPIVTETKVALPVNLDAVIGRAKMSFRGTATDVMHLGDLKGVVTLQGPSLAAVGDPLRVTLPTTGPFDIQGQVAKTGVVWNAVLDHLAIGTSRLSGAFTYDPRPGTPLLAGRLSGSKLALADLGPAVGTPVPASASAPSGVGASAKAKLDAERSAEAAAKKSAKEKSAAKGGDQRGRVLPDRDFDLPSLRAMNANVLVDIANLDLGSSFLEPLRPLRAHLVLNNGVLGINEIDARTGQGTVGGSVRLDGRNPVALWDADLRWDNVRLDSWIHQTRKDGAPPYIAGLLDGRARVAGQGKSTAAILGSLTGGVRMNLVDGSMSHLAVEAAGLDVAQALGVFFKGDDSLPMQCAVADLVADHGKLNPRVMVVKTKDSVLWVDGSLSLASEALDLRLRASPLDFSPFALRTPISVKGDFADPKISIEASKLATRVGAAALLALVTPVAAIIPFFDKGSAADARRGAASCDALLKRIEANPQLSPPGTETPLSVSSVAPTVPGAKPSGVPTPWATLPPANSR